MFGWLRKSTNPPVPVAIEPAVEDGFGCPEWAMIAAFDATCSDLPEDFIDRELVYPSWRAAMLSGAPRPPSALIDLLPPPESWPSPDRLLICDQGWAEGREGTLAHLFVRTAIGRAWAMYRHQRDEATRGGILYRRFIAVEDRRTLPAHAALHGVVLPVSDPWWNDHLPPRGWGCRCTTIVVNERTLQRRGWAVTTKPLEGGC